MKTYKTPTQGVIDFCHKVRRKYHNDLEGSRILWLFDDSGMKRRNREIWAKIRKATPVEHHIAEIDLVVIINEEVWHRIDDASRTALIDHELCHVDVEVTDHGEVKYSMVDHDLEEFNAIVRRHGAWRDSIRHFNQAQTELELVGDDDPKLPRMELRVGEQAVTLDVGVSAADAAAGIGEVGSRLAGDREAALSEPPDISPPAS